MDDAANDRVQRGRGFQEPMDADERERGDYDSLPQDRSGPGAAKCKLYCILPYISCTIFRHGVN